MNLLNKIHGQLMLTRIPNQIIIGNTRSRPKLTNPTSVLHFLLHRYHKLRVFRTCNKYFSSNCENTMVEVSKIPLQRCRRSHRIIREKSQISIILVLYIDLREKKGVKFRTGTASPLCIRARPGAQPWPCSWEVVHTSESVKIESNPN